MNFALGCGGVSYYEEQTQFCQIPKSLDLGTIHIRRRQIFTIFEPLPSEFQQNAYEGDF